MAKLPKGWTVVGEEEQEQQVVSPTKLPKGWSVVSEQPIQEEKAQEEIPQQQKALSEESVWDMMYKASKAKTEAPLSEQNPLTQQGTPVEEIYGKYENQAGNFENLSVQDMVNLAQNLKREREFVQGREFSKGALSGLTFGASENLPALKRDEEAGAVGSFGHLAGSALPLHKLIGAVKPAAQAAVSRLPAFQKPIESLLTVFGAGSATKGLEQFLDIEDDVSLSDIVENGAEWVAVETALNAAGMLGRFGKSLYERSRTTGKSKKQIFNDVAKKISDSDVAGSNPKQIAETALEMVEKTGSKAEVAAKESAEIPQEKYNPEYMKTKKVSEDRAQALLNEVVPKAEEYSPAPRNFSAEMDRIAKEAFEDDINYIGEKAASKKDLGNKIKESINKNLEAEKELYKPLYDMVEKDAKWVIYEPQETARLINKRIGQLEKISLKPEGYNSTLKVLKDTLKDLGYKSTRDEATGLLKLTKDVDISAENLLEIGRRLNEIIDFTELEPTVKNILKRVVKSVKQDVRNAFEGAGEKDLLKAFNEAELAHAKTAKKYGRESIKKIRNTEAGEKIAAVLDRPSTLEDLKNVLDSKQYADIERELLEDIKKMSHDKAKNVLEKISPYLRKESKKAGENILKAKNPMVGETRRRFVQEDVLKEMGDAFAVGNRPKNTLELWKTPKGQSLVKDAFKESPNWPEVKNYLEMQSYDDMLSSVLKKDGSLDVDKFVKFMSDPAMVKNIREQGGEQAVEMFTNLDAKVKQLKKNMNMLSKVPNEAQIKEGLNAKERKGRVILERMANKDQPYRNKLRDWESYIKQLIGLKEVQTLNVFGGAKLIGGITGYYVGGIPAALGTIATLKLMNNILTDKKYLLAFKDATKQGVNPFTLLTALHTLTEE